MKAQPCMLVVWNRWGYPCLRGKCESKAAARRTAREMIEDGFGFSYKIITAKVQ